MNELIEQRENGNTKTKQELIKKISNSINTVKMFREFVYFKLNEWKCHYSADDIKDIMRTSGEIKFLLDEYNLELIYKIGSPIITVVSKLDSNFKVSVKFFENTLTDKAYKFSQKFKKEYEKYVHNSKSQN